MGWLSGAAPSADHASQGRRLPLWPRPAPSSGDLNLAGCGLGRMSCPAWRIGRSSRTFVEHWLLQQRDQRLFGILCICSFESGHDIDKRVWMVKVCRMHCPSNRYYPSTELMPKRVSCKTKLDCHKHSSICRISIFYHHTVSRISDKV